MGIENININIKQFDEYFGSKLKDSLKSTPVILDMFHSYIEQIYKTNKLYKEVSEKILEIEKELDNSLTDEQKKLIEKWEFYKQRLTNYTAENAFIYGVCLDKELYIEKETMNDIKV